MTNEEKVEALVDELGIILGIIYTESNRAMIKKLLMKIAEWKDEQFAKEKQALIDKACEWLRNNKEHPLIGCEDPCLIGFLTEEFIMEFRKTIEGGKNE